MNARVRDPRVQRLLDVVELPGVKGQRWTAGQLARTLGIPTGEVTSWIRRGVLRASRYEDERGVRYAIKRSAIRRAFRDNPKLLGIVLGMPGGEQRAQEAPREDVHASPRERSTNPGSATDHVPPEDPSKRG